MKTINEETRANLALILMQHVTEIPRSVNGYEADIINPECTEARRADAIAMIGRHCPKVAEKMNECLREAATA